MGTKTEPWGIPQVVSVMFHLEAETEKTSVHLQAINLEFQRIKYFKCHSHLTILAAWSLAL